MGQLRHPRANRCSRLLEAATAVVEAISAVHSLPISACQVTVRRPLARPAPLLNRTPASVRGCRASSPSAMAAHLQVAFLWRGCFALCRQT
jgi:hypothetical protein